MQPFDITFFKTLKTYYYQAIEHWMHANPGKEVTLYKVCRLFGIACGKIASVSTVENGF